MKNCRRGVVAGLLLVASVARAELVAYRDYDAVSGTFTNAVRECAIVTDATRTLEGGWYSVNDVIDFPRYAALAVRGTAHLILCDGASLKVEKPGDRNAA